MKHYLNVCDVKGAEVEPVDVITFGSPCQDLSVAGKRTGLKHQKNGDDKTTRSGLFMEAVRIIKEMREEDEYRQLRSGRTDDTIRPRFAVWENVPGAFSSNKGEDFRVVLEELARIKDEEVSIPMPKKGKWKQSGEIVGDGWSIAWRTLDAQYHGVPQRRRRIFLVADFADECAGEILFECKGLPGYPSESGKPWEGAARDFEKSIGESGERECAAYNGENITSPLNKTNPKFGDSCHTLGTDSRNYIVISCEPVAFEPGLAKRDGLENRFVSNCSPTIRANMGDNQTAVAYGICSYESNSMKSDNPHSGIYEANTARTLDLNGGNPACNQGGICICEPISIENHPNDSRIGIREDGTVQSLTGRMGTGGGNVPLVAEPYTYCYVLDRASFNQGENAQYDFQIDEDGVAQTLVARGPGAVCYKEIKYIVRRLTPTECARLQGMPDMWCRLSQIEDMSDEDYEFWKQAHKTYAEINGKNYKEKTKQQMIAWYKKLHVDGAEYKVYGNGMALPCVRVPIHGIAKHGAKTMGSLFDGIGGFPLAGLIDGIKTLWTSEIELFPIAVTMERFREFEKYGYFTFGYAETVGMKIIYQ